MASTKYSDATMADRRGELKPYSKEELRAMLPKVGDRRLEKMSASTSCQIITPEPLPCTVVEVNEEAYWYRVQFDRTGVCQCYKLPATTYNGPRVGWT